MSQNIDHSILSNFCSNKSLYTREPFCHKKNTYAADGYCFISLSKEIKGVNNANNDQIKYIIDFNTQLNQYKVHNWMTISLDNLNTPELKKCTVCKGSGRLQTGLCPYCDKGLYRPSYEFKIEGYYVNGWKVIDILSNFTNVQFGLVTSPKRKVIKAQFNEGYAYLACWRDNDKNNCKVCVL